LSSLSLAGDSDDDNNIFSKLLLCFPLLLFHTGFGVAVAVIDAEDEDIEASNDNELLLKL